ncbi:hypothetical protein LCGC14_1408700 [marine sediment metagenome]|uniref:UDP-N-acetylglucosamine 2-epimerase domain-containing protein n=1 Tax=marine sediment metagenome TaxID=412755 RepID=A0A0F9JV76_9ZZZZ
MKIILVGGARPNFIKIAPLIWELKKKHEKVDGIDYLFVHTGQHYDNEMSNIFLKDLDLPNPDINLRVGSASNAVQTANIMIRFEQVCINEQPDIAIVVGDVNSTIASTLVAAKLGIKTAHVESGLRSFDRTMPEEINRILTDSISELLFTTCRDADDNLRREGIPKEKIFFVGNIMIDSLNHFKEKAKKIKAFKKFGLSPGNYAVLTLHRPSNVDDKESLKGILSAINDISNHMPIVFPIHPRTRNSVKRFALNNYLVNKNSIHLSKALSYLEFISLLMDAKFVLTDSGGIQEETTILGIPCLTLRNNTERPITVKEGTNTIIGNNSEKIIKESMKILKEGNKEKLTIPELWDGNAAKRIIDILISQMSK